MENFSSGHHAGISLPACTIPNFEQLNFRQQCLCDDRGKGIIPPNLSIATSEELNRSRLNLMNIGRQGVFHLSRGFCK